MKYLQDILTGVALTSRIPAQAVPVEGLCFDSRQVRPGYAFVAIRGTRADGHQFIPRAIENGANIIIGEVQPPGLPPHVHWVGVPDARKALALMAANFYDRPSEKLQLIGVTGTNGKTTTVTLLYQLMAGLGIKAGLLSTIENKIASHTVSATHTTPDPVTVNRLLADMVQAGCEYAFMEVSSHAIDQHRIDGLRFAGAVFTNLTPEHLDYHKDMKTYMKVKKSFFDSLPDDAFALVNIDDKHGPVMWQNTRARRFGLSLRTMADFHARIQANGLDGLQMTVEGMEVHARLVGRFNAYNLLTAYAVARILGFDARQVLTVLSNAPGAPGRFETIRDAHSHRIGIVDYAHTPDALVKVLDTILELRRPGYQVVTVVGCGGDRDKTKRPLMGAIAAEKSDQAIFTEDNPRNEDPDRIIAEMLGGVPPAQREKVLTIRDRRTAIRTACRLGGDKAIILVAGKGHEKYQIVRDQKIPFDDREELIREFERTMKATN